MGAGTLITGYHQVGITADRPRKPFPTMSLTLTYCFHIRRSILGSRERARFYFNAPFVLNSYLGTAGIDDLSF